MYKTTLTLPRLAPGVDRDAVPAATVDGSGVNAAAVDCRKLRGLARDMCYKAMALAQSMHDDRA